jgi:glycosyltransferase involved in cell wall biosynthesis
VSAVRVALVVPSLGAGGAERVASRLAGHWAGLGHEVHLLLLAGPGQRPYYPLPPAVRLHALDLMGRSSGLLDAALANWARIRRLRRALSELALAAAGRGPPVIVAERNSPDEPLPRAWRAARWLAHRAAAAVVFQTERARAAFAGPAARRGVVIPNPVAPPADACRADPAAPALVAAGRLVPQKGFDLLVEAFAAVAADHPAWTLTIWGEGPERGRLEALVGRRGLAGRVRLPGTSAEPGAWLRGGSVFVLPSRFEGFPNVLCEAMAAGYAVLAADCRFGPREIVSDGEDGLLVPPEDPRALAEGLRRLMAAGPARRRALGDAARRSVERLDPGAIAGRWDALLASVTAGGGARP